MSFENLDFLKLGHGIEESNLEYTGKSGHYSILDRKPNYYVLSSKETENNVQLIDTIYFDSLP